MTLNLQQLKQIIQYNAKRMYFGEWQPSRIDDAFRDTSGGTQPEELFVGELTEDIICDVLWYEMSYNPLRFGSSSPFKKDGKNSILHFIDTYRKTAPRGTDGLLSNEVITLVWQINDFVKNLKKANLYEMFTKTGKLPSVLSILGADENYYILSTLRKAIHTIAKLNWLDAKDPAYKEHIEKIAAKRHPTGKRSDISYMFALAEFEQKTEPKQIQKTTTQQNNQKFKVVQTCLPFFKEEKVDNLAVIRGKIVQKQNEIATIEQTIKDMREMEHADLKELYKQLKHAKSQYAGLCGQEMRLVNKMKNEKLNGKCR